MKPEIRTLAEKKLVGKRIRMSMAEDKTSDLWRSFMPVRNQIKDKVGSHFISLRQYDHSSDIGDLNKQFDKWAAAEVNGFDNVPDGMETLILEGGLYAVFHYIGSSADPSIFFYIYAEWLPASGYTLDERPHFEILGDKYRNNDPESEEEIWIPVRAV